MNSSATTFNSIDEIQTWLLRTLLEHGDTVSPRGATTREVLGIAFSLRNPRFRTITNKARRFSLPLALGEFAWHMRAADDAASLAFYAKRWADFSSDSQRITGSCYGSRIFKSTGRLASQWERVVDVLREDRFTRRAVLSFWDNDAILGASSRDVPCTCTIQFLIRDERLHAVVTMRSNDTIWGVPYDVFLFTMLQEYLAATLGLELGEYTHFAASMHLYERHYALAERILQSESVPVEMPRMSPHEELPLFLAAEEAIRSGATPSTHLSAYWRELADVIGWFRAARDAGSARAVATQIPTSRYESFLQHMVLPESDLKLAERFAS